MRTDAHIIMAVVTAFASVERPQHFGNYAHCEECQELEALLSAHDRDTLTVDQVDIPWLNPIAFSAIQGKAYYLPNLVRFALEDSTASYWPRLIECLEGDGPNNALIAYCCEKQRLAIVGFLEHFIETRATCIEAHDCTDQVLRTHGHWAGVVSVAGDLWTHG